jgi:hypothetical protein
MLWRDFIIRNVGQAFGEGDEIRTQLVDTFNIRSRCCMASTSADVIFCVVIDFWVASPLGFILGCNFGSMQGGDGSTPGGEIWLLWHCPWQIAISEHRITRPTAFWFSGLM